MFCVCDCVFTGPVNVSGFWPESPLTVEVGAAAVEVGVFKPEKGLAFGDCRAGP